MITLNRNNIDKWQIFYLPVADRLYFADQFDELSYPETLSDDILIYYRKNVPKGIIIDNAKNKMKKDKRLKSIYKHIAGSNEEYIVKIPKDEIMMSSIIEFAAIRYCH